MRIHREEAFGPVATLYRVADLDEAVQLANDTPFGLSSNVWTRDADEVDRFVRDLEAGGVYFNGMTASHPAPALRRGQAVRLRAGAVRRTESASSATSPPSGTESNRDAS